MRLVLNRLLVSEHRPVVLGVTLDLPDLYQDIYKAAATVMGYSSRANILVAMSGKHSHREGSR
jgi:hypothetical protein